jgi:DNA replication protein DnaC
MNASTVQKLKDMHCDAMAEELEAQMRDPDIYTSMDFEERLARIVDAESDRRRKAKLQRYIKSADFDLSTACIEDIEYFPERKLDKAQILRFATCEFIDAGHNIVFKGASVSGKSYIAQAIGNAACRKFKKVKYIRMPALLDELATAKATGEFRKIIKIYQKLACLLLMNG